ncbi:hypothetical protein PVAP13_3NG251363 [Panicum virgatum]|uniref:Uncharacterized protein n=1 Tax=Panicum virgatum TaxID=38727 RepID=A0A8T0ULL9_PANVG|nr:hypothetical protein PVAP13_3NG251363 [Panicum virgatum]KAG2621399.1 hypothetical protein PVAP13_3NG251363 [Panicum virgatum]
MLDKKQTENENSCCSIHKYEDMISLTSLEVHVILDSLHIWELTRTVNLIANKPDVVVWKWTADNNFSTASAYACIYVPANT